MNQNFSAVERATIERLEKGIDLGTVLPIVGAGVSRQGANLPRWGDLLAEALEWTERKQERLQLSPEKLQRLEGLAVDSPTADCYETWVNTVFCRDSGDRHWNMPAYREWLQEVFGAPSALDNRVYEALRAMDPRVIVTTNYDKLLTSELMPDGDVVTWDSKEAIRALLRERQGVLYLHGTYDKPESVVLASTDYERIIQNDLRSEVAKALTSRAILLFVGISPEGATDRHLSELLKLGLPSGNHDGPQPARTHVLLHRGELEAEHVSSLTSLDIEPVRFGDEYEDLAPFLERLSRRRSEYRNAADLVGLDRNFGESLTDSRWAPQECLDRVENSLRFMGLRSSKWVRSDTIAALDAALESLDAHGEDRVRFLILNPECEAYGRLEKMRRRELPSEHLQDLAELEQTHPSLVVKCVDFISAFRFTAVDDREIGLALYPTNRLEFKETNEGWTVPHYSLHTNRSWSLGRSLVFMFDEHFRDAQSLRKIKPELYS